MDIKVGQFYENKTWKYLAQCLRWHGNHFVTKFKTIYKLAYGVHDEFMTDTPIAHGRYIYMLCDKKVKPRNFEAFIEWIKGEPYYITDYPSSHDLSSRKHMLVISLPMSFDETYDNFIMGNYSKMFNDFQLNHIFNPDTNQYKVLTKDVTHKQQFITDLDDYFDIHSIKNPKFKITMEDFKDTELELPLIRIEEVFNYDEKNQHSHFITNKEQLIYGKNLINTNKI